MMSGFRYFNSLDVYTCLYGGVHSLSALREILNRYIGRCVAVHSYGYRRYIGKVAAVTDEFVVLKNASILDDFDGSRWDDEAMHSRVIEDIDVGFAETVLALTSIASVTTSDNDGLESIEKAVENSDVPLLSIRNQPQEIEGLEVHYDAIELQLGVQFLPHVTQLIDRIGLVRNSLAQEIGFRFPKVRLRDSLALPTNGYSILVGGTPRAGGELDLKKVLAVGPESLLREFSQSIVSDPVYEIPAAWIDPEQETSAEEKGLDCHSFWTVLMTHLRHVILRNLREIYSFEITCQLVTNLSITSPALSQEFYSGCSSRIRLHEVLLGLVTEGVCLAPIDRIAEAAALASSDSIADLVDRVRIEIVNSMIKPAVNSLGQASRIVLSKEILDELPQIVRSEELLGRFRLAMFQLIQTIRSGRALLLAIPYEFRYVISKLLADYRPMVMVISVEEFLHSNVSWKSIPFSLDTLCGISSSQPSEGADVNHQHANQSEIDKE